MVYGEHVARAEASAEEVDQRGEQPPPDYGTKEEAGDDERVAHHTTYRRVLGGLRRGHYLGLHLDAVVGEGSCGGVGLDNLHNGGGGEHLLARELDIEHREEGEDIGYDNHKVGQREAKHRAEVLPEVAAPRAVLADLWHGVLEEDEYSHNHDKETADHLDDGVVLVYVALQQGVDRKRQYCQQRIGTRHTQTRDKARDVTLAQGALYAQHRHGAHRDR